jgi:exodeoxyribonuclease-3
MRISTWNVNGIRACERKGFRRWLDRCGSDVVMVQETKCSLDQLPRRIAAPKGWHFELHASQRAGYSGVAVYSRDRPDEVVHGLGDGHARFDDEGRVLSARYGRLVVIGAYFPNGSRDLSRVPFKLEFYAALLAKVEQLREGGAEVVVMGDWNTAHTEHDLARPKDNKRTTGFLPEERAAVDRWLERGFVDAFRSLHPDARDRFTWWVQWADARRRNIGWRLDYHLVDEALRGRIRAVDIEHAVKGSDHCPVTLDLAGA